ncbi:hypothetical protein HYALB_00011857 [Hymenoscyphus albidus]|uniref:Uncharacterized protein n=1 Tax=Hymenoscyphus albidus TaxID=595503 RepID=A0A9N9LZ05_9HELO|nr:hypothetical protein HYALB_00011857 [Hymenoscyphus albidus]
MSPLTPQEAHFEPRFESAIFKDQVPTEPIYLGTLGLQGDSHAYSDSGGPDKALLHYATSHYEAWKNEMPISAIVEHGGFGENILTGPNDGYTEHTICVGDIFCIGNNGVKIQVTQSRQPCYKLNHRFGVEDMATRSQKSRRTGWHNRVLVAGYIQPGDEMSLVERKNPEWPLSRVQHYLYDDTRNFKVMTELVKITELGEESKAIFRARVENHKETLESMRLRKLDLATSGWAQYELVEKRKETELISSFVFERLEKQKHPKRAIPGAHIRVRTGESRNLLRAYSVVEGDSNSFTIGVSEEPNSKGGSKYLHEDLKLHDMVLFSDIGSNFPLVNGPVCENHIFVAGGIGITEFLASARILKQRGIPFTLHYAVKREQDVAFREILDEFSDNVKFCISSNGTRLDIPSLFKKSNNQTHIYTCGPDRLLEAVKTTPAKLDFPSSNIHSSTFVTTNSGDPFTVRIESQCKEFQIQEEESVLDVLRSAGFEVPSSCEVGNCGTCKVGVKDGRIEHRGTGLSDGDKEKFMLSCVSRGIGAISIDF